MVENVIIIRYWHNNEHRNGMSACWIQIVKLRQFRIRLLSNNVSPDDGSIIPVGIATP